MGVPSISLYCMEIQSYLVKTATGCHHVWTLFLTIDLSSNGRGLNGLPLENSEDIARVKRIDVLLWLLPTSCSGRFVNRKNAIDHEEAAKSQQKSDRICKAVCLLHLNARMDSELM